MGRLLTAACAAVAFALLASPARADGPPLSVPSDRLAASLECRGDLAAGPAPVLLVPGTGEDPSFFAWNYVPALERLGRAQCTVALPANGTGDIQVAAEYVVHAIRTMRARAGRRIAVLGHSQGGMVPRWALRWWPDTRAMVDDLIGLAASNHGTLAARPVCLPGCSAAVWQQRDDSRFLAALNAPAETWAGISYTSVYTRYDEVVTPNFDDTGSTALRTGDGARSNIRVQDVCPANLSEHLVLGSFDAVGYAAAVDALTHPGPADLARIDRAACTQPFHPGITPATFATDVAAGFAKVLAGFASGVILPSEPPPACYVTGSCPAAGGASGAGAGPGSAAGAPSRMRTGTRQRLRLVLGVRRVRAGRRVRLGARVTVLDGTAVRPVAGVRVRVGGATARTDRRGRATLRLRFKRAGLRQVTATLPGFAAGRAALRVVRR